VGDHSELLPAIERGTLDAAFVYDVGLSSEFQREEIYHTEVLAILPKSHELAEQADVDLRELANERLILLESVPSTDHTKAMLAGRSIVPKDVIYVPQLDLARALVGRGLGYS